MIREGIAETFSYYAFPREHRIRTNNMLERLLREIKRRTRVVGCFPDGHYARAKAVPPAASLSICGVFIHARP